MRETEYTYAVARIRANEQRMLSKSDLDLLISADSYDAALRILGDRGWSQEGGSGFDMCELEMKKTRDFIAESTSDSSLFNALAVGNDFANLKSAVKAFFSDYEPEEYMTCPYVCNPAVIVEAVKSGDFSSLPAY
ncbi:MAG: V-type ATPase subunit, partial [Clostridia bacterium]|nr:V-type ATPase subunit [Clostridia bacterium]